MAIGGNLNIVFFSWWQMSGNWCKMNLVNFYGEKCMAFSVRKVERRNLVYFLSGKTVRNF